MSSIWPRFSTIRSTFSKVERLTAVNVHSRESLILIFIKKVRRFVEYLVRRSLAGLSHSISLRTLRSLKGNFSSHDVLVLGNGPSVLNLDLAAVRREQQQGMHLVCVNWFPISQLGSQLEPDMLVLSDPEMIPGATNEGRLEKLWNEVRLRPQMKVVVPTTWKRRVASTQVSSSRIIYFNDLPLEGFPGGNSPTRARRYLSMTVYKAIAVALHLGYHRIFLLGVDNTMFRGLTVNEHNAIKLGDHHFYGKQRPDQDLGSHLPAGVADFFFDISLCFLHLKRCFGNHRNILNLDRSSLIDCFDKQDPRRLILGSDDH